VGQPDIVKVRSFNGSNDYNICLAGFCPGISTFWLTKIDRRPYRPWADNPFCSTVTRTNQLHHQLTALLAHITYYEELQREMATF